jgi:opacity protein-like surface antigen
MHRRVVLPALSVFTALILTSPPASGEWFADFYAGAAFTERADLKLTFLGAQFNVEEPEFDTSTSFGARLGYWFESLAYFGVALDVSRFRADMSARSITVCRPERCLIDPSVHLDTSMAAISIDATARWSFAKTDDFPKGRLQPYLTIGPTIFIARSNDVVQSGGPLTRTEPDTGVGPKLGAGLTWQALRNVALFGEYRFTHFSPHFNLRDVFFLSASATDDVKTQVGSHHLVVGLSVRF